jgi:hypothetical protein
MTIVLLACALVVGVPLVLALGARQQGRDVLEEMLRILHVVPAQIRDGAGRVCGEAWSRYQETLQRGGIRGDWVQQSVAALLFAPAALVGIGALGINLISTLAGTFDTTIPLIEALPNAGMGPAVLTGLEMVLACLLFPALMLDLMGITNISYFYSAENITNKWLRLGLMACFAVGTVATGYILFQSGILRGAGVEGAGTSTDLVQASGLESGEAPPESGSATQQNEPSQWTLQSLMTGPSLLGYIAGAIALVFVFPAAALLIGTPLFLAAAVPSGLAWGAAHLIVRFIDAVYNLMLSLFNFVLRLRGAEPVEGPGGSNLPDDPDAREDPGGTFGTNGRDESGSGSSGQDHSSGTSPARRGSRHTGNGRPENDQPENGQSNDGQLENGQPDSPAGDAAETGPLYDEDDENWNPIA